MISWQRRYSVGGFSPYFLATSVWAYAASHKEYKWAISISDFARLIALLNISIALSRLPLKGKFLGYFKHFKRPCNVWIVDESLVSPLNFNGSHSLISKVTFVVNLDGLADELQTQVKILLPLKL